MWKGIICSFVRNVELFGYYSLFHNISRRKICEVMKALRRKTYLKPEFCGIFQRRLATSQSHHSVAINPIHSNTDRLKQFQHIWKLFPDAALDSCESTLRAPPTWLTELCTDLSLRINEENDEYRASLLEEESEFSVLRQALKERGRKFTALQNPMKICPTASHQTNSTNSDDLQSRDRSETSLKNTTSSTNASFQDNPSETSLMNSQDTYILADPYSYVRVVIYPEDNYSIGPYEFPRPGAYPDPEVRQALSLNYENHVYVCIGEAYCFPHRSQLPTSRGTEPSKLYVDPTSRTPTLFLQLSPYFPPATWIPMRPSAAVVRRVLSEFAQFAVYHRDLHHTDYVRKWELAKTVLSKQNMPSDDGSVMRYLGWSARLLLMHQAPLREYPNTQDFFIGEYERPEEILEYIENCPFLFAIPEMRTSSMALYSRADGPGIAMSAFRCIYSKSVLWVKVHHSTEVKLPPAEPMQFKYLWQEKRDLPETLTPVFIRIVWPDNTRMCGGGGLIPRFNQLFETEFARDIPIDAVLALHYIASWAKRSKDLVGVLGMRKRVEALEAAVLEQPQPILPRFRGVIHLLEKSLLRCIRTRNDLPCISNIWLT